MEAGFGFRSQTKEKKGMNKMEKETNSVHGMAMAILTACMLLLLWATPSMAQETSQEGTVEVSEETVPEQENVQELEDVVVTGKKGAKAIELSPGEVVIDPENFPLIGPPGNLEDTLKTQAIFDFRGQTDLVPDSDTLNMRGFSSSRFVMALDGLTVQKTGGRKGTHIVDYSLLSAVPLDKIEIIAGPHSARYDSKSIGGVVNLVTQAPKPRDTLKPDISGSASCVAKPYQHAGFRESHALPRRRQGQARGQKRDLPSAPVVHHALSGHQAGAAQRECRHLCRQQPDQRHSKPGRMDQARVEPAGAQVRFQAQVLCQERFRRSLLRCTGLSLHGQNVRGRVEFQD